MICPEKLDAFRLFFKLQMQKAFYTQIKFHVGWMLKMRSYFPFKSFSSSNVKAKNKRENCLVIYSVKHKK